MLKFLSGFALLSTLVVAPATAAVVTYDAFTSFNGTQGAGGFTYGSYDGTTFTAFTGDTGCSNKITGVSCLGDLPGVFKTTAGAHQSGSVIVPADALILHPGPDAGESSAVFFTAPKAGVYTLTISAFIADTSPTGVNILGVEKPFPDTLLTTLGSSNLTFSNTYSGALVAGQKIGLAVDYDGLYYDDSTGINFTLTTPSAVPEPAAWALMIAGFGLVGFAARRRQVTVAA